jgi:hypothetical protein
LNSRGQKHFKTRFYVICGALIIALTFLLVWLLMDHRGGTLETGSLSMTLNAPCVIIRDEQSVYADRYNRITYLVREGERVEQATPVARVYKWGYSDDMTQSLLSAQQAVYEEQMAQTEGIANPELDSLNLQISQAQSAIRDSVMNGSGEDLLSLSNELDALLVSRADYLKQNVQPTEALSALYASEQERQTQLANYWTEVTSASAGVVSFYFDGYEQVLSADKLGMLNAEGISSVVKSGAQVAAPSESQLYRLVDDEHWYVAFVTQSADPVRVVAGEVYTVTFEGYGDMAVSGTALAPVASESGVLNVIEFYISVEEFLSLRAMKATIACSATGLKVPLTALTVKDNLPGVTIESGGDETFRVNVEVLASDGEYAVVRAAAGETLSAGAHYIEK